MKTYDVYAVGSALVDIEFEATSEELSALGIRKGIMTLVDEVRQADLMAHIHGVRHTKMCGGSAANTIVAVSRLGGRGFYSCRVASDAMGDFFVESLASTGVETNLGAVRRMEGITGKCLIVVTPDADRTMNTFLGVNEQIAPEDLVEGTLRNSSYLYIEGYLAAFPAGRATALEAVRLAQKHGVKTAVTFSDPSMAEHCKNGLMEFIGEGIDLLFCNEAEAKIFSGTDDVLSAANQLMKLAKTFVITLGSRGALVFDGETFKTVNAVKTKAVDTTGAGDTFAGAFLYGITHGFSFAEAGRFACLAAAKVVSRFGPRLEAAETAEVLARFNERS